MPLPHLKLQYTLGDDKPVETTPEPWRQMRGQPVGDSGDLRRIVDLPRRTPPDEKTLARWAAAWKKLLGKGQVECRCVSKYKRKCCAELLPTQAWALTEAATAKGLFGPIGVGHGKTLLDLLTAMVVESTRAVLLIPTQLKAQLLKEDWDYYGQHWDLPNLVGTGSARPYVPGRPALYVLAFSELSSPKATEVLEQLVPDTIIVDEGHALANKNAARTKRFLRYLKSRNEVNLYVWSGTLTKRSIKDYAHLLEHSLGEGAPVPLAWPTVEEWSLHLDPVDVRVPIGHLRKLAVDGKEHDDAKPLFQRRMLETMGVVTSGDSASCQASLRIDERPLRVPTAVLQALSKFEESAKKEAWQRPDGEEIVDALTAARTARELSCGFYYRWRWPRGERVPVIEEWLKVRKDWHSELRERLKRPSKHMDSPLWVTKAAIRWHEGYTHIKKRKVLVPNKLFGVVEDAPEFLEDEVEEGRVFIPPHTKNGPMPTWESEHWLKWKEVRNNAQPETEAVWLSEFVVDDALEWLSGGPGIAWYEFGSFASKVVERARERGLKLLFAGPGEAGNNALLRPSGSESVLASIRAHGTGKNLQAFSRNLVANPPSDGATWEQLLGRTHRNGQLADEVTFEVYRHSEALRNAVERARELSEHIEGTFGVTQRLSSVASWGF